MVAPDPGLANASQMETAARATFLRMTPRKWQLVRAFESVIRLLLPLVPPLRILEKSEALPSSILVVEYWNLGDLAIVVPLLKNLRRSYPQARISLLVNAGLARFWKGRGWWTSSFRCACRGRSIFHDGRSTTHFRGTGFRSYARSLAYGKSNSTGQFLAGWTCVTTFCSG